MTTADNRRVAGTDRRAARRLVAVGSGMLLLAGTAALPVLAQATAQEDFRTSVPELGGYTAAAVSSPITMQLFEPVIPVPAGPGEPHGEMHGSYSRATLSTGPASRGLGSAIWPGATAGDGLSAFDENIPPYPFKASATYPDGPFESGASSNPQENRGDSNTHTGMFAYAKGIDVYGESNGGGELVPTLFYAGNVQTVSTTTVVDGVVIAETIATMQDVSFGPGGLITMDGTQTRLIARSNGAVAETEGVFEVSGLEIMGQGFELTEDGVEATGPAGDPVTIPLGIGNEIDLSDAIGITVESAPIVEEIDGPTGSRSTRGMTITIDTTPLREAARFLPLADVIGAIPDPIGQDVLPCDQVPEQMGFLPCFGNPITALKANLFTLASLQPKTQYIIGGGSVSVSASLPFEFTPAPLPALPPPPAPVVTNNVSVSTPTFVAPPPPPPVVSEPAPQVAPAPGAPAPQFVALAVPEGLSRGLGAGAALLSLAGIGLIGRGGKRLTMAAIYGTSTPSSVGAGAVPDLRAFARGESI